MPNTAATSTVSMRTDETNALPLVGESASRPSNAAVSDDRTDEIPEDPLATRIERTYAKPTSTFRRAHRGAFQEGRARVIVSASFSSGGGAFHGLGRPGG